jgi:hypothetical protein
MNAERRKQITELARQVQNVLDEEQGYFDNMPEGLQAGDKGDSAQSAIDSLQQAVDSLEEIE